MTTNLNVVTGATGMIGGHIAEQLVARGEAVRALVRPGSDTSFLCELGVELAEELVVADVIDRQRRGGGDQRVVR